MAGHATYGTHSQSWDLLLAGSGHGYVVVIDTWHVNELADSWGRGLY